MLQFAKYIGSSRQIIHEHRISAAATYLRRHLDYRREMIRMQVHATHQQIHAHRVDIRGGRRPMAVCNSLDMRPFLCTTRSYFGIVFCKRCGLSVNLLLVAFRLYALLIWNLFCFSHIFFRNPVKNQTEPKKPTTKQIKLFETLGCWHQIKS